MTWEKGRKLCLWTYVLHTGNLEFWVWLWLLTNPWPQTSCLNSWISQMCALLLFIGLAMDFNKQTLSLIMHADALCYPAMKKKQQKHSKDKYEDTYNSFPWKHFTEQNRKEETRPQHKIQSFMSSDSESSFMHKSPLVDRANSHI